MASGKPRARAGLLNALRTASASSRASSAPLKTFKQEMLSQATASGCSPCQAIWKALGATHPSKNNTRPPAGLSP